jgi:iron(III) transport system ATP-binding protein
MSTLTLHQVGLSYGHQTALTDVSLVVPSGSVVAILGPSGCGKTTMLLSIAGLLPIDAGHITVGSRLLSEPGHTLPPEQRGIGWVPQDASLFPHLSVRDNIGFGLPKGAWKTERVEELAELVGLAGFLDRKPHHLSGGQAQRVALARALAPGPDVILLDEPFAALDSVLRRGLAREVVNLLRKAETTTVLVTHDREEALDLADFVVVMDQGRIVQVGTPLDVYESPETPWVASFVGDTVELTGVWRDLPTECETCAAKELCDRDTTRFGCSGHVACALGNLIASARGFEPIDGQSVRVVLRPEWLMPQQNGIPTTVVGVSYAGHDALVELELVSGRERVRARIAAPFLPAIGQPFGIGVRHPALVFPNHQPLGHSAPAANLAPWNTQRV